MSTTHPDQPTADDLIAESWLPCGHPAAARIENDDREDHGECAWCVDRNALLAELERQMLRAEAAEVEVDELRADLARKEDMMARILGTHEFPGKHADGDPAKCAICIYARAALGAPNGD